MEYIEQYIKEGTYCNTKISMNNIYIYLHINIM